MRRMILPLMLFAFVACQPAAMELTDDERATIAQEVTAIHTEFWSVWEEVDIERGMSYYRTDPDPVWAWNGEIRSGVDNLGAWFGGTLAGLARQEITFDDRQVVVLDRDIAYVIERGSFSAFDPEGVEMMAGQFAASVVWVRGSGEWKIAGGHESVPVPAPEPN
jgi:ketosteroid isomerase-like protein